MTDTDQEAQIQTILSDNSQVYNERRCKGHLKHVQIRWLICWMIIISQLSVVYSSPFSIFNLTVSIDNEFVLRIPL